MNQDLDAHYKLAGDIVASVTTAWNSTAGFEPIGSAATPFVGSFDGQNHTISDLYINRGTTYIALFSETNTPATISNVGLINPVITGVGAATLIGMARYTTIDNCYVEGGSVTSTGSKTGGLLARAYRDTTVTNCYAKDITVESSNNQVGGLIGYDDGAGKISKSFVLGVTVISTYSGAQAAVGGLIGQSNNGSKIEDCYAKNVTVTASSGQSVGGLIGRFATDGSGGYVYRTWVSGSITGAENVGGLIGHNDEPVNVYNSFSVAEVYSAGSNVGGFIGLNDGTPSIADSWWYDQAGDNASQAIGAGNGACQAASNAYDFYSQGHGVYSGTSAWDFTTPVWDDFTYEYPRLNWENYTAPIRFSWIGDGGSNLWSVKTNWYGGDVLDRTPGSSDGVTFSSYSTEDCTIDLSMNVAKFTISSGYTGTITQNASMVIGSQGWVQADGIFAGGVDEFDLNGTLDLSGGTFTATTGTFFITGNFLRYGNSTFNHNSGTIRFDNWNTSGVVMNEAEAGTETFNNLIIELGNSFAVGAGDLLIVEGAFSHLDGQIYSGEIEVRGVVTIGEFAGGGTSSAALLFRGTNDQVINSNGGETCGLHIDKASDANVVSVDDVLLLKGSLTISGGTFTAPAETLSIKGNIIQTGGVFDHNSGTVRFYKEHSGIDINSADPGTIMFNNLTVERTDGYRLTVATGDLAVVEGTFSHLDGTLYSGEIETRGPVIIGDNADAGTGTVSFRGGDDQVITATGGSTGHLLIDKDSTLDTITVTGNMTLGGGVAITRGTFIAPPGSLTMGYGIVRDVDGVFNHNSGTITLQGTATSGFTADGAADGTVTVNDLVINKGHLYRVSVSTGDRLVVEGSLEHLDGVIYSGEIEARGPMTVGDNADGGTGYIVLGGGDNQVITASGGKTGGLKIEKDLTEDTVSVTGDLVLGAALVVTKGTFIAPSGTMTISGGYTRSVDGVFDHNSGTVAFLEAISMGFDIYDTAPGTETFNNLIVNKYLSCWFQLASEDTIVVEGAFSHLDGWFRDAGTVEAKGDVTIGAAADGGATALIFSGDSDQNYTDEGGTVFSGPVTIDKGDNAVILMTNMTLDYAGQDLTVTSGILDLGGYDLTVNDEFTVGSSGVLALYGSAGQSIPASPILQAGHTISYNGPDSYTGLLLGYTYENLEFAGTGTYAIDSALDVSSLYVDPLCEGVLKIGADITTDGGDMIFNCPVVLSSSVTLDTGAGAGDITFGSSLDGTIGNETLTLSAGAGTITFSGAVGGSEYADAISYWSFDSGDADDEKDANNGTINGTLVEVSGKVGSALEFDATGDYIQYSNAVTPLGAQSISFWVKSGSSDLSMVIMTNTLSSGLGNGTIVRFNSGNILDYIGWGATQTGTNPFNMNQPVTGLRDNEWRHFVYTWDGTTEADKVQIYMNGEPFYSTTAAVLQTIPADHDLIVGKWSTISTPGQFIGTLDEISVWDKALTPTEIEALYRSQRIGGITVQSASHVITSGSVTTVGAVDITADQVSLGAEITTLNADITFNGPVVLAADIALDTGAGAGNITFGDTLGSDIVSNTHDLTLKAGEGSITFSSAVGGGNLLDGLINQWKLNDNANDPTVVDSRDTNNGTLSDGENNYTSDQSVAGKVGGALSFDGTNDYVDFGEYLFADTMTISAWVYLEGTGAFPIVASSRDDTDMQTGLTGYDTGSDFCIRYRVYDDYASNRIDANSNLVGHSIQNDGWHHIAITQSSPTADVVCYFDGNDIGQASKDVLGSPEHRSEPLSIGRYGDYAASGYFNGSLDEVRIYDQVLNPTEIVALYNGGNGTESTGSLALGDITIQSAGSVDVGASVNAASFVQNDAAAIAEVGGDITTVGGNITFEGPVVLTDNVALSTSPGAGDITFGGTLGSDGVAARNLTLTAGTGTITFTEAVGGDLSAGLVSRWTMNEEEPSGTTVYDDQGNPANDGTLGGGETTLGVHEAGHVGTGTFYFDGNDYILIANEANFDFTDNFTISQWVKPQTMAAAGVIFGKLHTNQRSYQIYMETDGSIALALGTAPDSHVGATTDFDAVMDTWYHVAWTFSSDFAGANKSKIYVDGVEVGWESPSTVTSLPNYNEEPYIGRNGFGSYFKGSIDEVRAYSRALTPSEIALLYNSGNGTESTASFDLGDILINSAGDVNISAVVNAASFVQQDTDNTGTTTFSDTATISGIVDITTGNILCDTAGLIKSNEFLSRTETGIDVKTEVNSFAALNSQSGNISIVNADTLEVTELSGAIAGTVTGVTNNAAGGAITLEAGQIELSENLTSTNGHITLTGPTVLTSSLIQLSTAAGEGNITFGGTLNPDGVAARSLTLTAGTGTITFTEAVGGDLSAGLVSRWTMNEEEAAGYTAYDDKGNPANDGTLGGGETTLGVHEAGHVGTGTFYFDGNDYILIANEANFDFTDNFTISQWVKPQTMAAAGVIFGKLHTNQRSYQIQMETDGSIALALGTAPDSHVGATTDFDAVMDTWYHVAWTFSSDFAGANKSKIYVDGVEVGWESPSTVTSLPNYNEEPYIGRNGFGSYFKGSIDEVRAYSRALTPSEIALLYNSGNGTESTGTLALGDITITSAGNIQIDSDFNAASHDITLSGNWVNNGSFDAGNGSVTFNGTTQSDIMGANTFDSLIIDTTLDGAKTVRFEAAETQVINTSLTLTGAPGKILTIESTQEGVAAALNIPGSISSGVEYVHVKDNHIDEGFIISATNSLDLGNTSPGWAFDIINNYTWIGLGSTYLWSDDANWQGGAPGSGETAYFTGISNKDCTINVSTVGSVSIGSGYTGIIAQSADLTVSGSFAQSGGTFAGDSNPMTVNGTYTLSGGTFTAPSDTLTIKSQFTCTGGTFEHNSGLVNFLFNATRNVYANGISFHDVTFTRINTSSNYTIDIYDGFTVENDLTVFHNDPDDTLTLRGGSGTYPVITTKNLIIPSTSGYYLKMATEGNTAYDFTFEVTGDVDIHENNLLWYGTNVALTGDVDQNINYTSGQLYYGTWTVNKALGEVSVVSDNLLVGGLTLTDGTFNAPTGTLTIRNAYTRTAGTFVHNNGLVTFETYGNRNHYPNDTTFYDVAFTKFHTSYNYTVNIYDNFTVENDLSIFNNDPDDTLTLRGGASAYPVITAKNLI
ncbi:LamG-like jellyroll fold domain-containing protein, partial [Candidatus Omnitrophota bacterium]